MNPFKRRKRQPKVKLEFRCTVCERQFKRSVHKVFVDMNTFEKNRERDEPPERSEYIIPERVECPRCKAVDHFELTSSSRIKIQTTILMRILARPDPNDPIQTMSFALSDGTPMHPLDALDMYAEQVARHPDRIDLRVRYGNTLRTLGYREEAETHYLAALERDSTAIEALFNVAALRAARGETQAAYDCLRRVVECAPQSRHPRRKDLVRGAQLVLDGEIKIEDFEVIPPTSSPAASPRRSSPGPSRPRPKRRRAGKKKKRRRK
jgi:hypothetical protein